MEQRANPGCVIPLYIIFSLIGLGLGALIPYYLCHIDPTIEAGWLRGIWHGGNFTGNLILSLFDDRLLKAPLHSTAYSVFWWIFTVSSCLMWFVYCINWVNKLKKVLSGEP